MCQATNALKFSIQCTGSVTQVTCETLNWRDTLLKVIWLTTTKTDASFSSCFLHGELIGLNGWVVDDFLHAGTIEFERMCQIAHESFEMSCDESPPITFCGFQVSTHTNIPYPIDQDSVLWKLEEIDTESSFSSCRLLRIKVALLSDTWPTFCSKFLNSCRWRKTIRTRRLGA